jgi:hypothetical protein
MFNRNICPPGSTRAFGCATGAAWSFLCSTCTSVEKFLPAVFAYLTSRLFTSDVVGALKPLLDAEPDVRIYKAAA